MMTSQTLKSAAIAFAAPVLALAMPVAANAAAPGQALANAQTEVLTSGIEVQDHHKRKHWKRGKAYGHRHYNDYDRYDRRDYRRARYYDEPVYRDTRVWRGDDGRYYCRKKDGTTGLLIGAAVGGLIGHEVAGRNGDRTLGAILGAAGGALLGRTIDRSNSRCR